MATKQRKKLAPDDIVERMPPRNLEAERAVIGSILLLPDVCDDVATIVGPEDFYDDANQRLFTHIRAMHDKGGKIDLTLLHDRLKSDGELELIGGRAYLAEIYQSVATAAHAVHYAQVVRDKSWRRRMIHAATDMMRDAYDESTDLDKVMASVENEVFGVRDHSSRGIDCVVDANNLAQQMSTEIDRRISGEHRGGLQTGFKDFDELTGGLHESELIILGARTSMGKTSLGGNIALNVALNQGRPTLFVSSEMSKNEFGMRLISGIAGVDSKRINKGTIDAEERARVNDAIALFAKANLEIDCSPDRTVAEIASVARRVERRRGLDFIIIDYLQFLTPEDTRVPRHEQVGKISSRLKALAMAMKLPILCLAQLGRDADAKEKPRLRHLRESGDIEQNADVVMLLHRPDADNRTNQAEVERAYL